MESSWCITTHPALRPPRFGLQPLGRREPTVAAILVNADLSLIELSDEKVLLAIAVMSAQQEPRNRGLQPGPARRRL